MQVKLILSKIISKKKKNIDVNLTLILRGEITS